MLLKDDSVLKSARVKGRNIILDTKKDLCLLSLSSITIRVFPCWQSQVWLNSCDNVSWHYFRTILSLRHALHREDILFLQWNSPLNVVGCPKYFESMNQLVFSGYQWYIWMYSAPKEKNELLHNPLSLFLWNCSRHWILWKFSGYPKTFHKRSLGSSCLPV